MSEQKFALRNECGMYYVSPTATPDRLSLARIFLVRESAEQYAPAGFRVVIVK